MNSHTDHSSEKGVEMTQHVDHRDARGGLSRLRRPRLLFLAAALIVAAVSASGGSAARSSSLPAPAGLKTFMKRLGEPRTLSSDGIPEFSRTPSFAWTPVRGASRYEFELATSSRFKADNDLVWSSRSLTTPAAAIPLALPWITGNPASLYWRVRAVNSRSVSPWSDPSPFNMRWPSVPTQWKPKPGSAADRPGYVRWHPVDGATGYQVWFVNAGHVFSTITNVADEREYYAFHMDPSWTTDVIWRVRAERRLYGAPQNKLPAVSYGPWSPVYHWTNKYNPLSLASEPYPVASVSNRVTSGRQVKPYTLMPSMLYSGDGANYGFGLHRVYVFSDRDCVNPVYKGAIVGGPAYAPRSTGPLDLPENTEELLIAMNSFLKFGSEGKTFTADIQKVTTTEATEEKDGEGSDSSGNGTTNTTVEIAKVDLWDRPWPNGRYYWTVVPVDVVLIPPDSGSGGGGGGDIPVGGIGGDTGGGSDQFPAGWEIEYHDVLLSQDQCAHGRRLEFGKQSIHPQPADVRAVPYATGLTPSGRLLSATSPSTVFYGQPLVSWAPAPAADGYDVEWSRTAYPWRPVGRKRTFATSALLPLEPGTWYYRVRGVNAALPGIQAMTWSRIVRVRIASPTFAVIGG
jgi:hypothetical protein